MTRPILLLAEDAAMGSFLLDLCRFYGVQLHAGPVISEQWSSVCRQSLPAMMNDTRLIKTAVDIIVAVDADDTSVPNKEKDRRKIIEATWLQHLESCAAADHLKRSEIHIAVAAPSVEAWLLAALGHRGLGESVHREEVEDARQKNSKRPLKDKRSQLKRLAHQAAQARMGDQSGEWQKWRVRPTPEHIRRLKQLFPEGLGPLLEFLESRQPAGT